MYFDRLSNFSLKRAINQVVKHGSAEFLLLHEQWTLPKLPLFSKPDNYWPMSGQCSWLCDSSWLPIWGQCLTSPCFSTNWKALMSLSVSSTLRPTGRSLMDICLTTPSGSIMNRPEMVITSTSWPQIDRGWRNVFNVNNTWTILKVFKSNVLTTYTFVITTHLWGQCPPPLWAPRSLWRCSCWSQTRGGSQGRRGRPACGAG